MVYFATGELGLDGGIMVTASHNPAAYTGMKIVRRGALPVGSESGLVEIRDRAVRGEWREATRGSIEPVDVWDAFVERVLSFVDVASIAPLRIVVDAANGMAGEMLPPRARPAAAGRRRALQLRAGRDVPEPRAEPAPAREPGVHRPAKTREEGAAFGVAYDGDADRCFFVDDTGEFVPGDFTTALFAESMLAREPGGKVIYDVRASWAVPRGDRARRAAWR